MSSSPNFNRWSSHCWSVARTVGAHQPNEVLLVCNLGSGQCHCDKLGTVPACNFSEVVGCFVDIWCHECTRLCRYPVDERLPLHLEVDVLVLSEYLDSNCICESKPSGAFFTVVGEGIHLSRNREGKAQDMGIAGELGCGSSGHCQTPSSERLEIVSLSSSVKVELSTCHPILRVGG